MFRRSLARVRFAVWKTLALLTFLAYSFFLLLTYSYFTSVNVDKEQLEVEPRDGISWIEIVNQPNGRFDKIC